MSSPSDPTPEPHQHPPRRRLVKSSSLNKREPGAASPTSAKAPVTLTRTNKGGEEHSPTPVGARRPALNPPPQDARPLGRQGSRNLTTGGNKTQGDEALRTIQQGKRNALARAAVATGSYKSFDSPFGNYLLPVVPVHLLSKPAPQAK